MNILPKYDYKFSFLNDIFRSFLEYSPDKRPNICNILNSIFNLFWENEISESLYEFLENAMIMREKLFEIIIKDKISKKIEWISDLAYFLELFIIMASICKLTKTNQFITLKSLLI